MLRKNTDQIISICIQASKDYDELCRGFLGAPGKIGIERKIEFLTTVSKLPGNTPEEAFIKIYDFYRAQKSVSRLGGLIESALMRMLGIKEPVFKGNTSLYMIKICEILETIEMQVGNMKEELGIYHSDDIPLATIRIG
jgi:hypothetical protein